MMSDRDPRTPDVGRTKASVLPSILLIIAVTAVAWAAYALWPTLQETFSAPPPASTGAPAPAP